MSHSHYAFTTAAVLSLLISTLVSAADPYAWLYETSLLQIQANVSRKEVSSRDDPSVVVSSTAIGCSHHRWILYSQGSLPTAWPDACIGNIVQGDASFIEVPDAAMISKWKNAPCACNGGEPPIMDVKDQLVIEGQNLYATLEVYARTNAINQLLDTFLEETPNTQVVLLGAGLDGRFYSLPSLKKASKLFEVDEAQTQSLKKAFVKNCGMKPVSPGGVSFITIDLSKDNVNKNLFESESFDKTAPTIFISESLFQYLTEENVQKTLKFLAESMGGNQASRLIVHSWKSSGYAQRKGLQVDADTITFEFPDDAGTRASFFEKVGLQSHDSPAAKPILDEFYNQTAGLPALWTVMTPNEYLDVLVPLKSE